VLDVFLTGSAPSSGKTHVAIGLLRRELARRRAAGYVSAVQLGPDDDARTVAKRAPGAVCLTVHRYRAILPPAAAARLEHADPPRVADVVEAVERLRAETDGVVVEGPGGLLDPLDERETVADLAAALRLPLLIVARPEPGALNAVALTLDAARSRGLPVAGIVVNACSGRPSLVERTMRAELGRLGDVIEALPLEPATA
jgi:dethiobiotin synthetase